MDTFSAHLRLAEVTVDGDNVYVTPENFVNRNQNDGSMYVGKLITGQGTKKIKINDTIVDFAVFEDYIKNDKYIGISDIKDSFDTVYWRAKDADTLGWRYVADRGLSQEEVNQLHKYHKLSAARTPHFDKIISFFLNEYGVAAAKNQIKEWIEEGHVNSYLDLSKETSLQGTGPARNAYVESYKWKIPEKYALGLLRDDKRLSLYAGILGVKFNDAGGPYSGPTPLPEDTEFKLIQHVFEQRIDGRGRANVQYKGPVSAGSVKGQYSASGASAEMGAYLLQILGNTLHNNSVLQKYPVYLMLYRKDNQFNILINKPYITPSGNLQSETDIATTRQLDTLNIK